MHPIVKKRIIKSLVALLVLSAIFVLDNVYQNSYGRSAFFTGWILFSIMVFLLLFNLRKKLSFLPLGSAYTWAQLHIYTGILMLVLFFVHINNIPNGFFEILLTIVFISLSLSGLYGLYISRILPPRLSNQSEYVIYERIPGLREKIRKEIEIIIDESRDSLQSKALVDFYDQTLFAYLAQAEDFWRHLFNTSSVYALWNQRYSALSKYLTGDELSVMREVQKLTFQKIDIDNQQASRSMLKFWLFIHIPLSYMLLVMVVLHLMLTYSFGWGSN